MERSFRTEEGRDGELPEDVSRWKAQCLGTLVGEATCFFDVEPELGRGVGLKIDEIPSAIHPGRDEDGKLLGECVVGALGFTIGEELVDELFVDTKHIACVTIGDAGYGSANARIEEVG